MGQGANKPCHTSVGCVSAPDASLVGVSPLRPCGQAVVRHQHCRPRAPLSEMSTLRPAHEAALRQSFTLHMSLKPLTPWQIERCMVAKEIACTKTTTINGHNHCGQCRRMRSPARGELAEALVDTYSTAYTPLASEGRSDQAEAVQIKEEN